MDKKKILNWVLAATLVSGTSVFTACTSNSEDNPISPEPEPQTTLQVGSYVWGSTIYDMGTDGAKRLAETYKKAGIQHAVLLIKGEAGTVGYFKNSLSNAPLARNDRDIAAETITAMHECGIKVYAWLTTGVDAAWVSAHPEQGSYHFRTGFSDTVVDLYKEDYQEYMGKILKEIEQNYAIDGFAIDMMRYRGMYWGWGDSDYRRLTASVSEGGYGLTLDEYNDLVTLMAKEYNYPTSANAEGRLVYDASAPEPGKTEGVMVNAFNQGVKGVVAFAKMREKVTDDFSEYLVSLTEKPVYVAAMPECSSNPVWATLSYGLTYNQAYTFDVVCPMLYSADYSEDSNWVLSNINYLKGLGYKTVMPSLQAYRDGSTKTLSDDINSALSAGCNGYILFRTGTYDIARCTVANDNTIELTYIRGTDSTCGNLTVNITGATPTSVAMGGQLSSTQYELQGNTIVFPADALEKLGDYGTVTIKTSGSGKASASVDSDARIVYNVPIR